MQQKEQILVDLRKIALRLNNRVILEDIDLQIKAGETVSLVGPNGAGKSSLIKIVLGLMRPSSGTATLVKGLRIGYMPQALNIETLMPLTVSRFLLLAPGSTRQKCAEVATMIGIKDYMHSPLQNISGGELQRVLLARALLNEPNLLVLDEPAQGVDINGQSALYKLIMGVSDTLNCGILMVSHDLHLVIAGADRVVCLNKHICCSGHPSIITQHPEFIQLFGSALADGLAVYQHNHDHCHDAEGNIIND